MNSKKLRTVRRGNSESGYALLFAVFLAASMFLLAAVAAPSILNDGRRVREEELIWRGNQYMRGIRLYYQKNGRLPQNKDELVKGSLSVHFLRKKFTDPVNTSPDDWRFIYTNPSGQLIGSVRYHTLQEMAVQQGANSQSLGQFAALFGGGAAGQAQTAPTGAGTAGARGGPVAAVAGLIAGGRGGPGGTAAGGAGRGGAAANGTGAATGDSTGTQSTDSQSASSGTTSSTTTSGSSFGQPTPVPLQAVDGPVLGGSMIGIASKVKKDSLIVYQGKDNYFQWEFIWNPLLNRGPGGTQPQQGIAVGAPTGAQPGVPGTTTPGMSMPGVGMPNQQTGPAPGTAPFPIPTGPFGNPGGPPDIMGR